MDGMDVQPPLSQAPEVILGVGWSYSADIWNLSVLVRLKPLSCVARVIRIGPDAWS